LETRREPTVDLLYTSGFLLSPIVDFFTKKKIHEQDDKTILWQYTSDSSNNRLPNDL